jgi:hypothetical protein
MVAQMDRLRGISWCWAVDTEKIREKCTRRNETVRDGVSFPRIFSMHSVRADAGASSGRWKPDHDCWLHGGAGLRELLVALDSGLPVAPAPLAAHLGCSDRTVRNRLAILRLAALVVPGEDGESLAAWSPGELERLAAVRDRQRTRAVSGRHQAVAAQVEAQRAAWAVSAPQRAELSLKLRADYARSFDVDEAAPESPSTACRSCGVIVDCWDEVCPDCDEAEKRPDLDLKAATVVTPVPTGGVGDRATTFPGLVV